MPEYHVLHRVCVKQPKVPVTEGKVREDQGKRTGRAGFTSIQTGVSHAVHDGSLCRAGYPTTYVQSHVPLSVLPGAGFLQKSRDAQKQQDCRDSFCTGFSFPRQYWLVWIREFALNHTATWLVPLKAKASLMEALYGIKDNQRLYWRAADSIGKRMGRGISPKICSGFLPLKLCNG